MGRSRAGVCVVPVCKYQHDGRGAYVRRWIKYDPINVLTYPLLCWCGPFGIRARASLSISVQPSAIVSAPPRRWGARAC